MKCFQADSDDGKEKGVPAMSSNEVILQGEVVRLTQENLVSGEIQATSKEYFWPLLG